MSDVNDYFRLQTPDGEVKRIVDSSSQVIWRRAIEKGTTELSFEGTRNTQLKSLERYGLCTQPSGTWNTAITQFGKVEQRNLPSGYTELDYIQSDGSQYIDLNTTLNQDDVIEIEFEITASQNSKNIFGYRDSASSNNIMLFLGSTSNRVVLDFNNSGYASYRLSYDITANTRYKAIISKNRRAILAADGMVLAENTTLCEDTIVCPSAYLFAAAGTPAYNSGSPCKVYSCVINGKRNLVGAKDASNVVEMYDKVTAAPFINAGTGSFTAGPNATPMPGRPMGIVCNNGVLRYGAVGKNLVNITTTDIEQGSIASANGSNTNSSYRVRTIGYYPVKPNTQYTLSCVIDGYTSGSNRGVFLLEYTTNDVNGYTGDSSGWKPPDGYAFITGASTNFIRIVFAKATSSSSSVPTIPEDVSNVQLEYGETATAYEPFVGGIVADGTPETLTVRGVNLFDKNTMDTGQGYYVNTNGVIVNGYNANRTVWIPCKPNTKYSYWHTGGAGGCRSFAMNKDTIAVNEEASWLKGAPAYCPKDYVNTITTPADAVKLYITAARSNLNPERSFDEQLADFMVVEGEVAEATAYEPYVAPQTVNDVPMLLGLDEDYRDAWEAIAGQLAHNVAVLVLDGSEDWSLAADNIFQLVMPTIDGMTTKDTPCLCTHYLGIAPKTSISKMDDLTIKAGYNNASNKSKLYIKDSGCSTPEELVAKLAAQYAAGTPVIVLYPLATETTEQTTAYPQLQNKGYTIASVTAEVSDIQVTFTTGEQTAPTPYSSLPIVCNNGELKWNGTSVVADGTPEVLTVRGKNLINEATCTLGIYVNPTTGVIEENANYYTTEKMYLANGTYTYSQDRSGSGSTNDRLNIATYNADDTPIGVVYTSYKQSEVTVTLSGSYAYVRISYRKTNTDIMLEIGETATAYEAYSAQTVNDIPMLLSVGGYADEAELISGIKTGKVGVYVFTGEETGIVLNGAFRPGATSAGMFFPKNVTLASTHFKSEAATTLTTNMPDGSIKTNQTADNTMYMKNLACEDVAAYQAWLAAQYAAGTPVIVVYPLADETTEQGTPQSIQQNIGPNFLNSSASILGGYLITYYGE